MDSFPQFLGQERISSNFNFESGLIYSYLLLQLHFFYKNASVFFKNFTWFLNSICVCVCACEENKWQFLEIDRENKHSEQQHRPTPTLVYFYPFVSIGSKTGQKYLFLYLFSQLYIKREYEWTLRLEFVLMSFKKKVIVLNISLQELWFVEHAFNQYVDRKKVEKRALG